MNSKVKKTLNVIVNIILVIYLIFAITVCAFVISTKANGGIPSLFGYSIFSIRTDSMEDTLHVGDLIVSKRIDSTEYLDLKENDIITYYFVSAENEDGSVVKDIRTHRIVSVIPDDPDYGVAFYTKGDNVDGIDEKVPATDVIAKYTGHKLPRFLSFLDNSQKKPGERNNTLLFILVIPLAIFFLYALYKFVRAIVETKVGKNAPNADSLSDEEKRRIAEEYLKSQGADKKDIPAEAAEKAEEKVEDAAEEIKDAAEDNSDDE